MGRKQNRATALSCLLALYLSFAAPPAGRVAVAQPAGSQELPKPTASPQAPTGRSYDATPPARRSTSPAPQFPSPVTFADVAGASRISFRHYASPTSQKYLPETIGGGVAAFDLDNDGLLDLYFTNGAKIDDPMPKGAAPDKSDARFWNRLYRQKKDGTFEDLTEKAGVKGVGYSMGVAAADYDNDGWTDLFVTHYGGSTLYRNRGDATFEDVTAKTKASVAGWPTSAGWFDYDRDGRLDVFVTRYLDWDFERGALLCGDVRHRAYCHPDNFKGATNVLLRQKPDATFEDVSAASKIGAHVGKGLGVAFADFDDDGRTDVFVANDSVRQFLFRNAGDGTFEEVGLEAGAAYDENAKTFAGMGVDAADFDNDGRADVFVTALSNETYPLFVNNGDLTFTYATNTSGVGQITVLYSGWGTRFADFDNDGLKDVFVAQGHVLDTIEKTTSFLSYKQTPLLMRNTGKGFVNVSANAGPPFGLPLAARGAATLDFDDDGDTDLVVAQTDGPPLLLRNGGTKNRWLGLSLVGVKNNRQGLGARVTVTDSTGARQVYEVTTAGSYLSSSDPRLRIGLGSAMSVRSVEIKWSNGHVQTVANPPLDKYLTVNEK